MPDDVEIPGIQLLLLDEHLLTNADFAEVVQESRVAQLAELLARELEPAIRANAAAAPDGLGETHGEGRDTPRVTGRRRIALLDRRYRCRHEPLEQALDVLIEQTVFDG